MIIKARLLVFVVMGVMGLQTQPVAGSDFESLTNESGVNTVTGRVWGAQAQSERRRFKVYKNADICGASVPDESLLMDGQGALSNAVVVMRPLSRKVSAQPQQIALDNRLCAFIPHVQATTVGSNLLLKNSDPILHTVHARLEKVTLFNVGLPRWRTVNKLLGRPGIIKIDCDVLHTWMSAVIVVTASPYFRVTDKNGSFAFSHLPSGKYEMQIWHERLGVKTQFVDVSETSRHFVDVVYGIKKLP